MFSYYHTLLWNHVGKYGFSYGGVLKVLLFLLWVWASTGKLWKKLIRHVYAILGDKAGDTIWCTLSYTVNKLSCTHWHKKGLHVQLYSWTQKYRYFMCFNQNWQENRATRNLVWEEKKMHRSEIKNHFWICIKVLVLHNILPVIDEVYGVLQGFNINYW